MRRHDGLSWAMVAILSVGGTVFVAAAGAQDAANSNGAQWLALMDPDKDGTVTKSEYLDYMDKQFDKLDTDHDGTLGANELKNVRGVPMKGAGAASTKQLLAKMDPDKDGTVSKDEFNAYLGKEFDRLDPDHDATLDAKELQKIGPPPAAD